MNERGKIGVTFVANGDHNKFSLTLNRDVPYVYDEFHVGIDLHINVSQAIDLFWWLIEVIPHLQEDCR